MSACQLTIFERLLEKEAERNHMKKVLCLLLCLVMLLGVLVACGGNETTDKDDDPVTDAPGNETNKPSGETNKPSGDTDTPGGETNPPTGETNPPTGETNPPTGETNPPTGETNSPETNPPVTPPGPGSTGVTTVDPEISYDPEDFGNPDGTPKTFTVLVRAGRHAWFHGTDKSTDEVSIAAYKRNKKLNEMYNIELTLLENESTVSTWRTTLDAADGNIDLSIPDFWWGLEYEGFFINLMRRPEINDADPHWIQGWNENLIINNRLYTITGDAALELMENWYVIFYNRDMAKDLGYYEDLFDLVDSGAWTVKEMMTIMDDFELALMDNDESNDVWGYVSDGSHGVQCALYSAGLTLLETNRFTNIINDISNTQKNISLTADITALRYHNAANFMEGTARGTTLNTRNNLFFAEQSFFHATYLLNGKTIKKSAAFDYGILIMPKYDAADDYVTTSYGVSFFTIPHSALNKRCSAVVLNTMNWLSNTEDERGMGEDRLVYTYYETVVKGQVANKAEDFAMLDTIRNSAYYDFGTIVSGVVPLESSFEKAVANNESISVTMGEVAKKAEDGILEMMTFYGDPNYAN